MTQRERHTPDGGLKAVAPTANRSASPPAPSSSPVANAACLWDEFYHRASAPQQDALLALAARQGVVYAHQIAPPENGSAPRRPLLPALLNGQCKDLQPLRPPRLEPIDATLDEVQREAVARALHTPDICLIQGLAGTGKSRVVSEIIVQATARGERVLLLAPAGAALDRVLEQVGGHEQVYAVRVVSPQENLATLPPCIRRLTVNERLNHFREHTLPTAQRAVEASVRRRDELQAQASTWKHLEELVAARHRLDERLAALTTRRDSLAAEVERDSATRESIAQAENTAKTQRDLLESRRVALLTEIEKNTRDLRQIEEELQPLIPLAEARRTGQWWSSGWWRALGKGDVVARHEELSKQRKELQAKAEQHTNEQTQLERESQQNDETCRAECARLRELETSRRQAQLTLDESALQTERQQLEAVWAADWATVATGPAPEPCSSALQTPRAVWQANQEEADAEVIRAKQWAEGVEAARDGLPERIARCANVVAATTTALGGDAHFGEKCTGVPVFDLLILEDADQVTESEFVHAARRARRWVLVGEPMADAEASDALPRRAIPGRPLRPAALRPGFFQRLWQHLHADPRRLPYRWMMRDGRLVCRLRPVAPDQQSYIEKETVADRPEIELRIISPPRQLPHLVEVAFPGTMPIAEAKDYIFREIGEIALEAHGPAARWVEEPHRIVLHLGAALEAEAISLPLAQGVHEHVARLACNEEERAAWHTCGLTFDRDANWTLERAQQWVEEQVKLRDLGRTAFLGLSYRMRPALAQVLSDILSVDDAVAGQPPFGTNGVYPSAEDGPCFEFVAIPTMPPEPEPRRRSDTEPAWQGGGTATAARPRTVRGGAGLEVDLADPRRLEPLPNDLRGQLPVEGLVNYLEAQAVVRCLESLIGEIDIASNGCQRTNACHVDAHCPIIAVMALYPAQVELLRRLIQRSPILTKGPAAFEVGLPADFRHRECQVAVVSLTRSHSHRAVAYGDHPRSLVQALTRARRRVIVFGDPGTLARRSQWQGPVDHLDETGAGQERRFAEQLLRYIHGGGTHPPAFQFREGSSV